MIQHIWHHLDITLQHALHPKDLPDAELLYFPDAELGGDALTTKATGGFWVGAKFEVWLAPMAHMLAI